MTDDPLSEGFPDPPKADYGNVPFWWWDGDRLEDDRITDQLERLAERGVEAVCFEQKYPHGPPEGPDDPYFSEDWWDHMEHAAAECDRLGMHLWIHDETYHHSPPSWKRYWQDAVEREIPDNPEFQGHVLHRHATDVSGGETAELAFREDFTPVEVAAYPREDGALDVDGAVSVEHDEGGLSWTAPAGEWHVSAVGYRPEGLCRTSRDVVDRIVECHYEAYEERLGEYLGESVVGTFQDELFMLQGTTPCDAALLARYRAEWDEEPALVALFEDCGPDTAARRARYWDVVTTMLEENWFQPLYEWHERRGLKFAHDNWGREDLTEHHTEYGDYVRAMRWFQEPGYDDGLRFEGVGTRSFFDGKVASSIAANYGRERVWGELFHSTGWGFPPHLQFAGAVENACYGLSRYNKHGLYYATLGGWYEHAPPDTHFRQPYWEHADAFNDPVSRLMYCWSEADPVVDVAMHYPMTTVQGARRSRAKDPKPGPGARYRVDLEDTAQAVDERTREVAKTCYREVADLLFADDDSLADGGVVDGHLSLGGCDASVFLLGPTTTVRRDVLSAMADLVADGGVVVAVDRLPTATVEGGSDDPLLEQALDAVFGDARSPDGEDPVVVAHESGGAGILASDVAGLGPVLDRFVDRDVRAPADVYTAHRRAGDRDLYLVLNTRDAARTCELEFRADGRPERWDLDDGTVEPLHVAERGDTYTAIEFDLAPHEARLVGFAGEDDPDALVAETSLDAVADVTVADDRVTVRGRAASGGEHSAVVDAGGERREGTASVAVPDPLSLDEWTFDVEATLDNRWGDHRYPRSEEPVGPEVRRFRYRHEGDADGRDAGWHAAEFDDGDWATARFTVGPYAWRRTDARADADVPSPPSDPDGWEPYEFSRAVGRDGTHPEDHGFNGVLSEDFLVAPEDGPAHFWTALRVESAGETVLHVGQDVEHLAVDGEPVDPPAGGGRVSLELAAGAVPVHLVVPADGATHLAAEQAPATAHDREMAHVPRLRWFRGEDALGFDPRPWTDPVTWFRFELPAGTVAATLPVRGDVECWLDGERVAAEDRLELAEPLSGPTTVALRVAHPPDAPGVAAWPTPVEVETAPVAVEPGDWTSLGHESFSGVGVYERTVAVPDFDAADGDRVVLELGDVGVTARVLVDGEVAGTVVRRPFAVDVTEQATPGECRLTVRVANTVANHLDAEVPTQYVYEGQRRSGLLGPVELRVEKGLSVRP